MAMCLEYLYPQKFLSRDIYKIPLSSRHGKLTGTGEAHNGSIDLKLFSHPNHDSHEDIYLGKYQQSLHQNFQDHRHHAI